MIVKYRSYNSVRRGFKIRISELVHDCSYSQIAIDDFNPMRHISSPNFPNCMPKISFAIKIDRSSVSPNSLDCKWTLSAPPGRRLKFTIDPNTFHLATPNEDARFYIFVNLRLSENCLFLCSCTDDFIEVMDGPSTFSQQFGRYCGVDPPSTIFSTDSYLTVNRKIKP